MQGLDSQVVSSWEAAQNSIHEFCTKDAADRSFQQLKDEVGVFQLGTAGSPPTDHLSRLSAAVAELERDHQSFHVTGFFLAKVYFLHEFFKQLSQLDSASPSGPLAGSQLARYLGTCFAPLKTRFDDVFDIVCRKAVCEGLHTLVQAASDELSRQCDEALENALENSRNVDIFHANIFAVMPKIVGADLGESFLYSTSESQGIPRDVRELAKTRSAGFDEQATRLFTSLFKNLRNTMTRGENFDHECALIENLWNTEGEQAAKREVNRMIEAFYYYPRFFASELLPPGPGLNE